MFSRKRKPQEGLLFLHSPHFKGGGVAHLQDLLRSRGFYHGKSDGEFGLYTHQAVYRAKYWLGYPKPNHVAGQALIAFLDRSTKPTARMNMFRTLRVKKSKQVSKGALLIREACRYLGMTESPPNSNRVLFSAWYGMVGSWCAMFVSYVARKVGYKQFIPGVFVAYVPFLLADARQGRRNLVIAHPSALRDGDIPCYDWPGESPGTPDHTGYFATEATLRKCAPRNFAHALAQFGALGAGEFWAVEGNTAVGNDSNGGQVMIRKRSFNFVEGFVRIVR